MNEASKKRIVRDIPFMVYLTADEREALGELAESLGLSMGGLIRMLLRQAVKRQRERVVEGLC